jgi:glutamyl-tRNA synthetase
MNQTVRGRLAPSPTGAQHVGNARSYLIAWLSARSRGGSIQLRIEDIDIWRNKPDASAELLADLRWMGLDWDGDILEQSSRIAEHEAALERLKDQELVYPCTCSRGDIAAAASAPHLEHEGPVYPGTCAHRKAADADMLTEPYSWRFRVTDSPKFTDRFAGETQIDLKEVGGDFVIWRAAKVPAYQLAVVADDADAGITEVVRGDDLLTSTPRQLLLYRALGKIAPEFVHVPMVVGEDGRRLAKRHGDTRLSALRINGVRSERFLGLLAYACGWLPIVTPVSAKELIPLFQLNAIPREPFVLTRDLLHEIGYM